MAMTNDERALAIAARVKEMLELFSIAQTNAFTQVGPSEEFLNTHLPASVATHADIRKMVGVIDEAARNKDMKTINAILGTVTNMIGPLKLLVGGI